MKKRFVLHVVMASVADVLLMLFLQRMRKEEHRIVDAYSFVKGCVVFLCYFLLNSHFALWCFRHNFFNRSSANKGACKIFLIKIGSIL